VLAGGLDDDLRRAGVVALALSGAVEDRFHAADSTPRLPPSREGSSFPPCRASRQTVGRRVPRTRGPTG
jgi:hypothetical protein